MKQKTEDVYRTTEKHPLSALLREDRIPHIWCPGCDIGTVFSSCLTAIHESHIDYNNFALVSGIGCSGRAAGYVKLDSFHTTHGRAIPFATGLKIAKPHMKIIVFSGDGDLFTIGGNHFIHAARRNIDLTVICVNNFTYGMTGGQAASTTPYGSKTTTTPKGNFENPFNLSYLAAAAGAVYVSRWTSLHVRRLTASISEAFVKNGFSFVEVVASCPTSFGRKNKLGKPLEILQHFHRMSTIKNEIHPKDATLDIEKEIVVGKFVDVERPTFFDLLREIYPSGKEDEASL
ncbi:MAG: thiamine pyrophosphate-dependent enzyme [Thermodesulfobacteriota bacterium]|nr:thiamine pyrophosphate-dependent enzyme [Thermodesulfobacteriota bacterium]